MSRVLAKAFVCSPVSMLSVREGAGVPGAAESFAACCVRRLSLERALGISRAVQNSFQQLHNRTETQTEQLEQVQQHVLGNLFLFFFFSPFLILLHFL